MVAEKSDQGRSAGSALAEPIYEAIPPSLVSSKAAVTPTMLELLTQQSGFRQ
ncbi:hypothetical protein GT037_002389 [Alternaria burnsii]|uniref:Uncharacterized protein n=1 Tax=Alternaria burnsii TaxID=1187904 RepID=A0A8H7BC62_9PLEO|nr:uncharacterized protein GT037_002389 [Alternaria burnsii]KAF7680738.1 hypothetical protein GT037_002389 [Alternaria burnsii]